MATNKLTDIEVKQANTLQKDYKITDGGGLYLLVKNTGTKCWRLAYRLAGKQKTLAIGTYPQIGLKDARKQREQAKEKLAKNIDPSLDKKHERIKQQLAAANTFEAIARDWWQHTKGNWAANHSERVLGRLGYDGNTEGKAKCVPHGLRTTACSILNEQGFNPDAIERQMSHMERNGVRAAYTHHAQYKDDRVKMMEWWGDYLESMES